VPILVKIRKGAAFLGELLEQRRWAPVRARLPVKLADPLVNLCDAAGIGVPHRSATVVREAVAIHINNVYVRSAESVTFFEDARTLVNECVQATIRDFLRGYFALRYRPHKWDSRKPNSGLSPVPRARSDYRDSLA
jgi:hypothetical protein